MANVQLPTINPDQDTEKLVKQLLNVYIQLTEELTFLLNNLDTKNVNELNAEVITAGSITADKIQARAISADKLDVNELSAISANLGRITAGIMEAVEIYGSYISTNRYGYPKVEISDTTNMLGAFRTPDNSIQIYSPSEFFSPVIKFSTPRGNAYITYDIEENHLTITSNDASININTKQEINILGQKGVWVNGQRIAGPV